MVIVVCTGGEAPPYSLCLSWLNSGHRTIAVDGGLRLLRDLGRRADLWIGDGDSLEGPLSEWTDWYLEAVLLNTEKDDTDTEAAVRVATEQGASEIWLLGGAGGRMDHWWANVRLASGQPLLTRWLTGNEEIWNLGPGNSLQLDSGLVSVFPLGAGPWNLVSRGLRWPLDGVDFSTWHSLSNLAENGAHITVQNGRFLVLKPFETGKNS